MARKKILVVDDTEWNRDLLVQLLEDDYEIIEAVDGGDGVKKAEQENNGRDHDSDADFRRDQSSSLALQAEPSNDGDGDSRGYEAAGDNSCPGITGQ